MMTCPDSSNDPFATTPQKKAFFDAFGFLVLRQAFSIEEFETMERAFEQVITDELRARDADRNQLTRRFVIDPGFSERHPDLLAVVKDERIARMRDLLLGPGSFFQGSDGNLYVGDTGWHADGGWSWAIPKGRSDPNCGPTNYYPAVKFAIYLDPVSRDTGCLRVIPGSQITPFHESLAMLNHAILEKAPHLLSDPNFNCFDLDGPDVPAYPLESHPRDLVLFNSHTWHGAFGGKVRRMIAMSYFAKPNDDQREFAEYLDRRSQRSIAQKGRVD